MQYVLVTAVTSIIYQVSHHRGIYDKPVPSRVLTHAVAIWNRWRQVHTEIEPDFSGALILRGPLLHLSESNSILPGRLWKDERTTNTMAEPSHLQVLQQGIEAWNLWRQLHHSIQPDFSGADFRGAHLRRVNLSGARLNCVDFSGADLGESLLVKADCSEANLSKANLISADLRGAILKVAILSDANLSEVILSDADLTDADLRGAILTGVEVTGTNFSGVNFSDADLRGVDLSRAKTTHARLNKAYF